MTPNIRLNPAFCVLTDLIFRTKSEEDTSEVVEFELRDSTFKIFTIIASTPTQKLILDFHELEEEERLPIHVIL